VTTGPLGVFDDPHYAALALARADEYRSAAPFPHAVLDDFLPGELARELSRSFPAFDDIAWIERDNEQNRRRYQHDETRVPSLLREMLRELNSRQFILFVETLTGIDNLLPDPFFVGGGVHESERGDFLNVHADFNWHHKLQAHRRCNVLIYLTEDWDEAWGGATELWDREMSGPLVSVTPQFNRALVFSTSEHSNHGQPRPNQCPDAVVRKVLNLYYYTTHRADEDAEATPHFTLYKTEASPFAAGLGADYRAAGEQATGDRAADERARPVH
jgi:hypothetical protein